ncbi:tryptophan 2,3-dioxygenase [Amycolatopsis sp. NPDC101161]|jgi:tryptophan 2,3-dioxygenase|uniref:tryptophan 2,3-dioxygenase n=1 Tax=Amycolatopsis sp. NPDC101161 TaxID=3363940 RepID=UPI003821FADE
MLENDFAPAPPNYSTYLVLDEMLATQRPVSGEHDELLFIVVHQVYELWFKQLLHELAKLQSDLAGGRAAQALHTLHRCLTVLRLAVSQVDVVETMTARDFARFRDELGTGSGLQSAQFRELEAVLGRRDGRITDGHPAGSADRSRIEAALARPSLFDSFVEFLGTQGYPVPVRRDPAAPAEPSAAVQRVLLRVYDDDGIPAQLCERLTDFDRTWQEWRYRHVRLVERMIGALPGTGGSSGASYLYTTLFKPVFPDLWIIRGNF